MGRKHDKKEEASIILEILNRIPLSKRFVSVDDILNSLASAEIDVSRRSLQRYLRQIRFGARQPRKCLRLPKRANRFHHRQYSFKTK